MHKAVSSRLTAFFNFDGNHLNRYVDKKPVITKSLCEDLLLHDQIFIPTQDYLTACGLILILGENGFLELLERDKLKFIRTRGGIGFMSGKGPAEIGVFLDPTNQRPIDSPIEQSVAAGLKVIEDRIKENKKLHDNIVQNSHPLEWSTILQAVKQESIRDLRYTGTWSPEYESDNPNTILLPKTKEVQVRVIGPGYNPKKNIADTLLALTVYNADLFLADKFDCQDINPFYPVGDILEIKANRLFKATGYSDKFWKLLAITGVPDLSQIDLSVGTNLKELLKVTTNKNAKEFRDWFHSNQDLSETEILREYLYVVQQVPWIQRLPSKTLRFVVTATCGLVPVVGQAVSFFDSFVIERLFRPRSPKFFIDDLTKVTGDITLQQVIGTD